MSGSRLIGVGLVASISLGLTWGVAAAPPEDRILPVGEHTSEKARTLARKYASSLRELNARIYHCLPWLWVNKEGIGFFRPKGSLSDERYLSLNVSIDQQPSPEFTKMPVEERSSSMFSRYVAPLLRRMARDATLLADPLLDGFTVIVKWLKEMPAETPGARPVEETIAAFMEKSKVADYIAGRIPIRDLAAQARVLAWNGETPIGPLRIQAWDDNFLSTFKVANYQPEPGASCP